jgi:CheY-like chemotaxis protein
MNETLGEHCSVRDESDRSKDRGANAAVASSERAANSADRRDEFVAMVAHEMRAALGALVETLRIVRSPDCEPRLIKAASDSMQHHVDHLVRLVDDLRSEFVERVPTQSRAANAPVARRRILVVDDNRDGAESLARVLELSGQHTRVTADGLSALREAEAFRPDVVLLDIGLPKLNGFEVARRLRQQPWGQSVILIAVTGWGQEEHRRESSDAGFDAHLVKPVDPIKLVQLLTSLTRGD